MQAPSRPTSSTSTKASSTTSSTRMQITEEDDATTGGDDIGPMLLLNKKNKDVSGASSSFAFKPSSRGGGAGDKENVKPKMESTGNSLVSPKKIGSSLQVNKKSPAKPASQPVNELEELD